MIQSTGHLNIRKRVLRPLLLLGLAAFMAVFAVLWPPAPAAAQGPVATVAVRTQRMSQPTLQSAQVGWFEQGSVVELECFERGQAVEGYYSPWITGGLDDIWYRVVDDVDGAGDWIADVDINTGSNEPVVDACFPPPGCSGDDCSGQDPGEMYCDVDAITTVEKQLSFGVLEVRWSPRCESNWARFTQYPIGWALGIPRPIVIRAVQDTGYTQSFSSADPVGEGTYWSPMIYSPTHQVRAEAVMSWSCTSMLSCAIEAAIDNPQVTDWS